LLSIKTADNKVPSLEALYSPNVNIETLWQWRAVTEISVNNIMTR